MMQLPRGTFCGIRKGETVGGLITELEQSKFSGICSLSSRAGTGTFVFKGGTCILAEFLKKSGDAGCSELRKIMTEVTDAALSTLDDTQIQLSLEFNKSSRLVKTTCPLADFPKTASPAQEPEITPASPVPAVSLFDRPAPPATAGPVPQQAELEDQPPAVSVSPAAADNLLALQPEAPVEEETTPRIPPDQTFENDIDTLENMDLDHVTDKIRNDCKTIIKQLHLEHLMER